MAGSYLKSLLGENEQVLFVTHHHWLVLFGEILAETFLSIAVIVLVSLIWAMWVPNPLIALGYLLLIIPLISLWRDVLIWRNREYVVTNRRVIELSGVFSKNVTEFVAGQGQRREDEPVLHGSDAGLRQHRNPDRQRIGREQVYLYRQTGPV